MDLGETDINIAVKRHPWEQARAAFVCRLLRRFIPEGSGRLLDLGCGDCYLLARLAAAYPQLEPSGCDTALTPEAVSLLERRYPSCRLYAETGPEIGPFDLITMCDVVEHVADDHGFLASIAGDAMLRSGGLVLITVPAFNALFSEHDRRLRHWRRYERPRLVGLAASVGLRPLASGYFFCSLLLPRLLQRKTGTSPHADRWEHGSLFTGAVRSVLLADAAICRLLSSLNLHLPGLSCYLIAQKP